jgi:Holliday junction resolvasome RuvABC DNA-binding subunit
MAVADLLPFSTNAALAANLREYADLLEQQGADRFRVVAYHHAADVVEHLDVPAAEIFASGGRKALIALSGIGTSIAAGLAETIITGRWSQLERLRGSLEPEELLQTIPGIGPELASRLCEQLHVENLAALEIAAYNGSLARTKGFGPRRIQMVRSILSERLGRPRLRQLSQKQPRPPVSVVLDVDHAYREQASMGRLKTIAPKRFNPKGRAWLPVMHTRRGPWQLTALFSNSRRANELGRVGDWVVIYYHTDTSLEGQCTIVTERRGPCAGMRVVRGREDECMLSAKLVPNQAEPVS